MKTKMFLPEYSISLLVLLLRLVLWIFMVIELVLMLVGNKNEDKCAFWEEEEDLVAKIWWWLLLVWFAVALFCDSFWVESIWWLLLSVLIEWSEADGGKIDGCEVLLRW